MRILGISGSLRRDSYNSGLIRAAAHLSPPGWELVRYEGLAGLPPYEDEVCEAGAPPSVQALRAEVARADGLVIATPEYNASIPGVLKNALDWLSRPLATNPLRGKPVVVLGCSTGSFGAIWAQADLRRVLETIGARVVGEEKPIVHAHERFQTGDLRDLDAVQVVRDQLGALEEALIPQREAAAA